MIKLVQLARKSDGKLLAETYDEFDQSTLSLKHMTKQICKSLASHQNDKLTLVAHSDMHINIIQFEGVCYIACNDSTYPKQLAFGFLQDIKDGFQEELKKQFGSGGVDFRSKIETIDRPYYFLRFDRFIKKKKQEFQDVRSKENNARLKEDLGDIQNIQNINIDDLIKNQSNINVQLKAENKYDKYDKQEKIKRRNANIHKDLYKIATLICIVLFVALLLIWKMGLFS